MALDSPSRSSSLREGRVRFSGYVRGPAGGGWGRLVCRVGHPRLGQSGARASSRFCPGLRCIGKAHRSTSGSFDLLFGQIEPSTAVALQSNASVGRKDRQLVAVKGHARTVLARPVGLVSRGRSSDRSSALTALAASLSRTATTVLDPWR